MRLVVLGLWLLLRHVQVVWRLFCSLSPLIPDEAKLSNWCRALGFDFDVGHGDLNGVFNGLAALVNNFSHLGELVHHVLVMEILKNGIHLLFSAGEWGLLLCVIYLLDFLLLLLGVLFLDGRKVVQDELRMLD